MKKLLVLVCGLLIVAGAAQAQFSTVQCIGTESGGPGGTLECSVPHSYTYLVTPGTTPISYVAIGTDDPMLYRYTNICAPAGWALTIGAGFFDHGDKTAHGTISGPMVPMCPAIMQWSGPAMSVPFELGFDHDWPSHNVGWLDNDANSSAGAPVGMGLGPLHAPEAAVPTLSRYAMIAIVVLLLAAGTVFIVCRRRVVA